MKVQRRCLNIVFRVNHISQAIANFIRIYCEGKRKGVRSLILTIFLCFYLNITKQHVQYMYTKIMYTVYITLW